MKTTIARILVPTDFSATADAALEYARAFAVRLGASLRIVHVIEEAYFGGTVGGEVYLPDTLNIRDALRQEAERLLSERVTARDREQRFIETAVVFGRSFRAIVEDALATSADLIVMGTHGRTGLPHLLLGSVAERIVRTAPCPVLTVREGPVPAGEPIAARKLSSVVV
jgi:nucleotide-binding universal stress UspA family protein